MARRSSSHSSAEQASNEVTAPLEQSIEDGIAARLEADSKFRDRYLRRWAANQVATELRRLRLKRGFKQADLAKLAGTGQSAISRIEKQDYDSWSFKTLLNIAAQLEARLRIELEPLEDVAENHRRNEAEDDTFIEATGETSAAAHIAGVVSEDDPVNPFNFSVPSIDGFGLYEVAEN